MTHTECILHVDWHPMPDLACLPGQSEGRRSRCLPASPPSLTQHARKLRDALPPERKLAFILTLAVWTVVAAVAEIIRLAAPLVPNV